MTAIQNWNPDELKALLDEGRKSIFLKLWKQGCGPCMLSNPAFERLANAYGDRVFFGQISVTDYPEMMELAGEEVLPMFFLFKEQKLAGKHLGFKGLAKLEDFLKSTANL